MSCRRDCSDPASRRRLRRDWRVGLACLATLVVTHNAKAIDIAASTAHQLVINATRLVAGAGTDLVDPLEDLSSFSLVITNAVGINYTVSVRKAVDYDLPGTVTLKIRRLSGSEEVVVGDSYTTFFQGNGNGGHTVRVILENVGIGVLPPATYSSDLEFTISEDP